MKRLIFFLAVALCGLGKIYAQTNFEKGFQNYLDGNDLESVKWYTKSIEMGEELAKSYLYRGAAYIFLNQMDRALIDLEKSKKLDPNNSKINFFYGKYYLLNSNYTEAIKYYDAAIQKDPKDISSYEERAQAKILGKDFKGAEEDATQAINLDPNDSNLYNIRGTIRFMLKRYSDSILDLDKSIAIMPSQRAFLNRGMSYAGLGEDSKAIDNYNKALGFSPIVDCEAYYFRGISNKILGNKEKACEDLFKSKKLGIENKIEASKERIDKILNEFKCN